MLEIANILEYGKHGQPPKPFLKPADRNREELQWKRSREKFEQEVEETISILQELNSLFFYSACGNTGIFSAAAPDEYLVLTPMTDTFVLYGDNRRSQLMLSDIRISLYSKGDLYRTKKPTTCYSAWSRVHYNRTPIYGS